ncbi:MAG: AtpZ/AtpI family protein [Candidatus Binatia bacterium]
MRDPQPEGRNVWVRFGELMAVAWEFLGSIIAGALLGYFADRHFDSSPWGLIACTLLGSCTGLYRMVTTLRRLERRPNA